MSSSAAAAGTRRVTIDLDPTDDATHGAQQLTFFNKYYDSWCYLPLLAFLTFDDETEQYLWRPCSGPGTCRRPAAPWACCNASEAAFWCGSTGALRPRRSLTSWMPSRGSTTSWRWRVLVRDANRPWRSRAARAKRAARPSMTSSMHVGPGAPRGHQSRGPTSSPAARRRQPALRRHQSETPRFIYERIYSRGERIGSSSRPGPAWLLGESTARLLHRRLCAMPPVLAPR